MKHLRIITIVSILAFVSVDTFAYRLFRGTTNHNHWSSKESADTKAVGAPLDGGLLAILGAAGVAYYAARKRKKKTAE